MEYTSPLFFLTQHRVICHCFLTVCS